MSRGSVGLLGGLLGLGGFLPDEPISPGPPANILAGRLLHHLALRSCLHPVFPVIAHLQSIIKRYLYRTRTPLNLCPLDFN